jgi:hypothetical protein
MDAPSPSMRELARQLLAANRNATSSDPRVHEAVALCETLRIVLTKFAGADGYAALLKRALALARAEVPALKNVTLGANCDLEGFEESVVGEQRGETAVALVAHLLTLLVAFIGEPLTVRLVREAWPDASLDT